MNGDFAGNRIFGDIGENDLANLRIIAEIGFRLFVMTTHDWNRALFASTTTASASSTSASKELLLFSILLN